ncbi:MAG: hypothetical protein ACUVTX_11745 [Bacteroidales bacterium]
MGEIAKLNLDEKMKNFVFYSLIILFSCSSPVKNKEPEKVINSLYYFEESQRWMKISVEYLKKQMYYVGRTDMTPEDHSKLNEYSALGKMAMDSAKFYMDKYELLERTEELKKEYNNLKKQD